MSDIPTIRLNDGAVMPRLGLGTARLQGEEARNLVRTAIDDAGYTLVDTAARYENEEGVGQGIADAGVPREDLFVTTKLRGADQGYDATKKGLRASLDRLGLDYVDLYLIHWPLPRIDQYVDSWRAMEELAAEGLIRSIGVSNFTPRHLDRLAAETSTVPAVNQIEVHPRFPETEQRADNERRGIVTEAWSPLANGDLLTNGIITGIAEAHGKSAAQVLLRWIVQQGMVTVAKSSSLDRLRQNLDVFDFELTEDDLAGIATLEDGRRTDPSQDPETFEEF